MIFRSTRKSGNHIGSPISTPLQTVWILSVLVFLIDYTFEVLAFNRLYESQHFLLTLLQLTLSLWAVIELLIIDQKQTPIPLRNLKIALFTQLLIGAVRFPIGAFFDSHAVFSDSFKKNLDFELATLFVPIYLFLFLVISKLVINAFSYIERQRSELLQTEIDIRTVAEESLRKSQERYRLIADRATDVIWTIDTSGRFTYVSPSVEKLRGYTPAEVMRQSMAEVLTPASLPVVRDIFEKSLANVAAGRTVEPFRGELEQPCKDGSTVWTEVTTNGLYSDDGQFIGFVGITRDITERRRFEAALRQARDAAETANLALQAANAELHQFATTDALTGAWNRRHFEAVAEVEIAQAQRYGEPVTLLIYDIDHFKSINDRFGHLSGDRVLVELTRLVRSNLRAADLLARWGGEEFVVMMPHCGTNEAVPLAEKLRALVAHESFAEVGTVTASFGVAELAPAETLDTWLNRADDALYRAKEGGRNRVVACESTAPDQEHISPHLIWRASYACGNLVIDEEHRKLFRLANELLDIAITDPPSDALLPALNTLMAHVVEHFNHEEEILCRMGYTDLDHHAGLHRRLIERARELRAQAETGGIQFGTLVEFLFRDVVARHMLQDDRAFYPLFAQSVAGQSCA